MKNRVVAYCKATARLTMEKMDWQARAGDVGSVPAVGVVLQEGEEAVKHKYQTEVAVLQTGVPGVWRDGQGLGQTMGQAGLGCSNLQL